MYDLHSGNPEDVYLALEAMEKPRADDDAAQEKIIILISSLLAWDATPRNLEEILSPEEQAEIARAEKEAKERERLAEIAAQQPSIVVQDPNEENPAAADPSEQPTSP